MASNPNRPVNCADVLNYLDALRAVYLDCAEVTFDGAYVAGIIDRAREHIATLETMEPEA